MLGLSFAALLYRTKSPWSKTLTKILFVFRAILIFLLALLLLEPSIKQIKNLIEKPVVVVLEDRSGSVRQVVDSAQLNKLKSQLQSLQLKLEEKGYQVERRTIEESVGASDFTKALRAVSSDFESKKISSVIFASDGIYNAGVSPLYSIFNFPIHTLALGDSNARTDLAIKNVAFNKIAYEGNRFPISVQVSTKGFSNEEVEVLLLQNGKIIDTKKLPISSGTLTKVDFQPLATKQGIQRYEVSIVSKTGEWNKSNNKANLFVEVVSGKKKILAIANAPHPDVKALRSIIEQNSNYEFNLYIPNVLVGDYKKWQAEADLIILFQTPSLKNRNKELLQQVLNTKASLFFVLGQQTDWQELTSRGIVKLEASPRQFDDVAPSLNTSFNSFSVSEEVASLLNFFPPASVPFTKIINSPTSTPVLFQKVGNTITSKPLLWIDLQDERKTATMLGEGLWRWRLSEYARKENTNACDELFGKLIQYLTTTDDRKKFRSYPVKQQFSDNQSVVFESQVYNEIFEPVFGNTINLTLVNEAGKQSKYTYTTSVGNLRYTIGALAEGVYRYTATTQLKEMEEVKGEFLVVKQQAELQNLTADFELLRKLSFQTGGIFYKTNEVEKLATAVSTKKAIATIQTEEKFDSLINIKWIFLLLLLLVSTEWFLRKYYGGY